MAVVRTELAKSRPDIVKELFRLLVASKRAANPAAPAVPAADGALDPLRFGVEACRPILDVIIDYCARQGLIPRKLSVDELFDDTTRALAP
jgi:4,5-dihydroxyphthalate decarboxylase